MNWLPGIPSVSSDGSIGRIVSVLRTLDQRRDESAEDDVDARVLAGEEVVGDEAGQRQDVGEGRPVAEGREMGLDRDAGAAHGVAALAADGDQGEVAGLVDDVAGHEPHDVRVQRTGQRAVRRDEHDQALAALRGRQQRVVLAAEDRREVGQDLVELLAVRPRRERRVLGALELRRGDELHRPRDLLDVLHGADAAPDVTLASHSVVLRPLRSAHGGVVACARSLTHLGVRSVTCSAPPCPEPPQRPILQFDHRDVRPGSFRGRRPWLLRASWPARRRGPWCRPAP